MFDFSFIQSEKHDFYDVSVADIEDAEKRLGFTLPIELRTFYQQVGSGSIRGTDAINSILDPDTIADITLREDVYEDDPDLDDIYNDPNRLVFFEENEGVYLTIDLSKDGCFAIY